MKESLKRLAPKLTLAASAFGVSLLLAPSAFATVAENSNTGAGSDNDATVTIENNVTISSNNEANIHNDISVSANTGNNSASKNTGDGSISTGDIDGIVNISNDVNTNTLNSIGFNCDGICTVLFDISASNSNTGADSNNDTTVNVENDIDITQNNDLDIDNDVDADLNTGGNDADKNTGDGSVKTGDISFEVNINNEGNENVIGAPKEEKEEPGKPEEPEAEAVLPEEGKVLAATKGLPDTGNKLPIIPSLALVLAGLVMKRFEEILRIRFLQSKN